jgi:hypothetical protein
MDYSSSSNSFIKDRKQIVAPDIDAKYITFSPISKNLAMNEFSHIHYSPMMKSPQHNDRGVTNHYSPFEKFGGPMNSVFN